MGPNGGSGYAEQAGVDATAIDATASGAKRRKGPRDREGRPHRSGDYPVVLEEYAVVDLLDMLGYLGFSALAVQEERSFVESASGSAQTCVDRRRGHDPAGLPMGFDYEGVAKQRVTLLEPACAAAVVYDSQTAARDGVGSTGHGLPAPNPWGPFPLNQVMAAGTRRARS